MIASHAITGSLRKGLTVADITYRYCTSDDFPAFHTLYGIQAVETDGGYVQSLNDLQAEMMRFDFDPASDLIGAFTEAGTMVGYAEFRVFRRPPVRPYLYGYTHPDYRGRGIGWHLIQKGLERARAVVEVVPEDARVVLQFFSPREDGAALLQGIGAVETRQSYIMALNLDDAPPEPVLPDGYRLATMADGATLEEIAYAHQESFRDHRGNQDEPLEVLLKRWQEMVDADSHFDPSLFAVAKSGDEIAAVVTVHTTTEEDENTGEVGLLGVLPDHRRQGLGLALLYFAFNELYRRDKQAVILSVDAASLTDAPRLYRRAGMHVRTVYHAFELELRPGVELTNQG